MAVALAVGERAKKLDLGRKQKLGGLVADWGLGLDWPIPVRHDENVQIIQIESRHWRPVALLIYLIERGQGVWRQTTPLFFVLLATRTN